MIEINGNQRGDGEEEGSMTKTGRKVPSEVNEKNNKTKKKRNVPKLEEMHEEDKMW